MQAPNGQFARLHVDDVIVETEDACSIVFQVPANDAGRFTYRPGQFLTLRLPVGNGGIARCYSLSSTPCTDARLKVTVKRVNSGLGSNWLCDNVKPGMTIDAMPPAGVFTPRTLDGSFILLAAGSGITPIVSIAKTVLAEASGHVTLIYANKDERSVIFRGELERLAGQYPDRLTLIHWLESLQGLPSVEGLSALVKPWADAEGFICGPEPFMQAARSALINSGADPARVHLERFTAADQTAPTSASPKLAVQSDVTLQAEMDGTVTELAWGQGKLLLDVLIDAGLSPPYSCRLGSCAACMCKVTAGEVTHDHNLVLEPHELAAGWVLACQARPASPAVAVSFDAQY